MKTNGRLVLLVGSCVLLAGTFTLGQRGPSRGPGPGGPESFGGPPGMGFPIRALAKDLGLSEEQMTQIREIMDETRDLAGTDRETQRAAMEEIQARILAATVAETLDEGALRDLFAEQSALFADGFLARQTALRRILLEVLTEEQREDALKLLSEAPHGGPGRN